MCSSLQLKVPLLMSCVLSVLLLAACVYEEDTKVSIDGGNPPTFKLYGSGNQKYFVVSEVPPSNNVPPAYRNPYNNIDLWKIVPESDPPPRAWDYPPIVYGNVPAGFRQQFPTKGAPVALAEGKLYQAGGDAYNANGGSVLFTIRNGRSVLVPRPTP